MQADTPEPAQCGTGCPPGQVEVDVSVPAEDAPCASFYDFHTAQRYEYLLTVFMQTESLYSDDYIAACARRAPALLAGHEQAVAANKATAAAESAAMPAIMARLIREDIPARVPARCRDDAAALAQSLRHFETWLAQSRATYHRMARDYAENALAATMECRHLTSLKKAYIFGLDFKDDIVLGVTAAHADMAAPGSAAMKDIFTLYKTTGDTVRAQR